MEEEEEEEGMTAEQQGKPSSIGQTIRMLNNGSSNEDLDADRTSSAERCEATNIRQRDSRFIMALLL